MNYKEEIEKKKVVFANRMILLVFIFVCNAGLLFIGPDMKKAFPDSIVIELLWFFIPISIIFAFIVGVKTWFIGIDIFLYPKKYEFDAPVEKDSIQCKQCHKMLLTEDITGDICPYCSEVIEW